MRNDIIEFLQKEIKERCESPSNFFGKDSYYHIKSVVKNATILAKEYEADVEVVIIAAWLHDIASITSYELYEDHHIHGARIAKEILERMDYSVDKIELVQKCILNHRGSKLENKSSKEEICVADGDAVSHFDNLPSLLYLAYVIRKYSMEEGVQFVYNKLKRSYNKLSSSSKAIYRFKYEQVMQVLNYDL
ncbi:MAG: HD domain-containing protein [Zhenhengia sp.]|uniref:HD domain-containing protein n=1 Tax=Zhenhengia sp. TaxID=2944208 RepID=UPI00291460D5|nr:HD domain-containing protein [Clostridiales bacterium]MDU6974341.1 HD domain-containing protein [Clostridiales bacterium]